jgi:type IV pilus assembly protein PilA
MRKLHTRRGGFTLIELMIVVAIIGILAAIAIPNFLKFQLRSKTGEAKTNLAALRTAEEGYFAEYGVFVPAAAAGGVPDASKQPWPVPAAGFDTVGWGPEGDVYFQYGASVSGSAYSLSALGDLDGGGAQSDFGYIHPDPGGGTVAVVMGSCDDTIGVYSPTGNLFNTVGPCEALDGQDEF